MKKLKTLNDIFIKAFLNEVLPKMDLNEKSTLLDLGCGQQPYRYLYENMVGHMVSTDIDKRGSGINCFSDAHKLPFKANSFDAIIMCEVLEHLIDPKASLAEAKRILKRNGHIIITWPFIYNIHEIPYDFYRITEFGIEKLLKHNHLKVVKFMRRGNVIAVLITILCQLAMGLLEALKRIPFTGFIFKPLSEIFTFIIQSSLRIFFFILKKAKKLNLDIIGTGLAGPMGTLSLWTLGYCVVARKNN